MAFVSMLLHSRFLDTVNALLALPAFGFLAEATRTFDTELLFSYLTTAKDFCLSSYGLNLYLTLTLFLAAGDHVREKVEWWEECVRLQILLHEERRDREEERKEKSRTIWRNLDREWEAMLASEKEIARLQALCRRSHPRCKCEGGLEVKPSPC